MSVGHIGSCLLLIEPPPSCIGKSHLYILIVMVFKISSKGHLEIIFYLNHDKEAFSEYCNCAI